MELDYKAIGKRIKIARIKADMRQEKLEERAKLPPTHDSNVETGTTKARLPTLVSLANTLGVTVDDLLCDNLIHARVQFERDIAELLKGCDNYEIRMVKDMTEALEPLSRTAYPMIKAALADSQRRFERLTKRRYLSIMPNMKIFRRCMVIKEVFNRKFSEHEYDSLRSEIVSRIGNINSQANSAIITILSTWSLGFALIVATKEFKIESIVFLIIDSFIFLVPIYYFVPLSIKSGENIQQIASISAYIKVFYEYYSSQHGTKLFNWETSNNIYSTINVNRGKKSILMTFYNDEYTILSVASLLIYTLLSVYTLGKIYGTVSLKIYIICLIVKIFLGLLSGGVVWIIHKASCANDSMMKNTIFYVNAYIERAIEIGLISPNERETVRSTLDPSRYIENL